MAFCPKCGAEVPEGSSYCPKCGASITLAVAAKKSYVDIGSVLILVGGILAIVFSFWPLTMMAFFFPGIPRFMGGMMGGMMGGYWGQWSGWTGWPALGYFFTGMIVFAVAVGLVGGLLAIYSWSRIRKGEVKGSSLLAIVVGGILLLTMINFLSGLLILAGGILCYTSE